MSDDLETESEDKGVYLFNRDVSKIPCFRRSFLYGIEGGLAFGLLHFLFTSKTAKSLNSSVYAFSAITLVYWFKCRYDYSVTKFETLQTKEYLQRRALFEGAEEFDRLESETADV